MDNTELNTQKSQFNNTNADFSFTGFNKEKQGYVSVKCINQLKGKIATF